jgi:sugar phosphate permease
MWRLRIFCVITIRRQLPLLLLLFQLLPLLLLFCCLVLLVVVRVLLCSILVRLVELSTAVRLVLLLLLLLLLLLSSCGCPCLTAGLYGWLTRATRGRTVHIDAYTTQHAAIAQHSTAQRNVTFGLR